MKSTAIGEGGETYVLVFDKGDEVMENLAAFASERELTARAFHGHRRVQRRDARLPRPGDEGVRADRRR
jgi:predicted DNA-binding protein with PD1-like motif